MSFLSSFSKGNHYRKGTYGSNHYKRSGIWGDLFNVLASRSRSGANYPGSHHNNMPILDSGVNQNGIICGKCNARITNGSKFCLQCGEKVSDILVCGNCGEKLPPQAKFCSKCGRFVSE
jgi:ribosomal protein L40E